jgi:hypothetical protein
MAAQDYFYLGIVSNSNSFVNALLQAASIFIPPPVGATGWGSSNVLSPIMQN